MTSKSRNSALKVLYVGYPLLPVSDESCGGAEQMLAVLEAEMARRGHQTTIAGCAGSRAAGEVLVTGAEAMRPDQFAERDTEQNTRILQALHSQNGRLPHFQLIHDKGGSFWRCGERISTPVLATLHLPRHFYPAGAFENTPSNVYFNCVSESQAAAFADLPNFVGVVENGIAVERFPLITEKESYLLWMGRICEEKGPHLAIEVAQRTGLPLVLAGQVYPFSYHQQFYVRQIRPFLGGSDTRVCFVETPTFAMKRKLLSEARAVLVPSLVDETSSLVSMEANACGTPVIAFRRGALPSVVRDRQTGFLVDSTEQMADAVALTDEIDPQACRNHVATNYPASRMADAYEQLYRKVLNLHSSEGSLAA